MTAADDRLSPRPGLWPDVILGDGRWERVVRALRATGTSVDAGIADNIDRQVQAVRRRNLERREALG